MGAGGALVSAARTGTGKNPAPARTATRKPFGKARCNTRSKLLESYCMFAIKTHSPLWIPLTVCGVLASCRAVTPVAGPPPDTVWVAIQPVQCLGNPWEKAWLAHHHNKGAAYPRDQELKLLREFFTAKGIHILDLRLRPFMQGTGLCMACTCPRGDTIYLLVSGSDSIPLTRYGYKRVPIPSEKKP